ncbi:hypothetical protein [Microcystis aeruginosa]|uniref:hypothetical protein n=1 Tax=Microcystis aeruginosa TaxID=1126 RepID=UPI001293613D|nr:hypothetical protein [Microcystis aeruginosa]
MLALCRSLDNGEKTEKAQTIEEFLETASIEELLSLKQNLETGDRAGESSIEG